MIHQRGQHWAINGSYVKYATREEAEKAAAGILQKEEAKRSAEEKARRADMQERLERLSKLVRDSTPFEILIEKNICTTCNLEPCECFTSIKRTEPGN